MLPHLASDCVVGRILAYTPSIYSNNNRLGQENSFQGLLRQYMDSSCLKHKICVYTRPIKTFSYNAETIRCFLLAINVALQPLTRVFAFFQLRSSTSQCQSMCRTRNTSRTPLCSGTCTFKLANEPKLGGFEKGN